MEYSATFSTTASIFVLLLAGYAAKRAGVLKPRDIRVVNSIIINITFPAFVFVSTHGKLFTTSMAVAPALGFVVKMCLAGAAYLAGRGLRLERKTIGALMLVSVFGNTGFMGYPVVNAAFPGDKHAMLAAVMFDEFGMALPLYTAGAAIATTFAGSKFEWKHTLGFLMTPIFPATILSLVLRTVWVAPVIMKTLDYAAAATVPLAMISIGMSLRTKSIREYPLPMMVATVLKMAALPTVMFFLLPVFGVHGVVRQTVVVQSALPTAVFAGVVSERFGANYEFAAGAIFLTTLLSVLVVPLVISLVS